MIAKELLQYEKDYIRYYINIPKLYYNENSEKDIIKNEMKESVNQLIVDDILMFMEMIEYNYNLSKENDVFVNCLTEFQVGYVSKNIISLAVEYSQLSGFSDISYIKAYNYDFNLRKELSLKDLFRCDVNFTKLLRKYINLQINNIFNEISMYEDDGIGHFMEDDIILDENNIFYFTDEYLILPFSSCELHKDLVNFLEFKIPFNKIYYYLNEYAIKNIVKKVIL